MHMTCADILPYIMALSDDIECHKRTESEWSLPSEHVYVANDSALSRNDSGMSGMSGDTSVVSFRNSFKSLVEQIEVCLRMCVEGRLFVRVCVCVSLRKVQ